MKDTMSALVHCLNVPFFLVMGLMLSTCSSSEKFSGFSYDPEGAVITSDKEIQPQHKRTIGIAEEGIWLSNEFPGARMNDFFKVNDSLYQIVIKPENHPVNNSPWYSFKGWADRGKNIRLQLVYKHGKHRYIPELSSDGKHWTTIDSSQYRPDTLNGTATLSLELSRDTLWISAQELVTERDYHQWADSLSRKPFVKQKTVGYSHQHRPVQRITISEVTGGVPRGVVIITGRLHPPEITGSMASFAFIEELASGSDLARTFRQQFDVVAYPFANPDGVQNGHWRHNAAGVDLNRDWMEFNQPETRAIRDDLLQYVKEDSLKKVYYGIDFHSTDEDIFYPIKREVLTFPDDFSYRWLDSLTAAFPDHEFAVEPFDTSSPITKNWIYRTFGADAITYEVNDIADRRRLKAIARKSARIMMRQLLNEMSNKLIKE